MEKARIIILTDIGPWESEPDDAQSLVRLMLYSNEYEIEGIIPSASWCAPDTSDEGFMTRIFDVIDVYREVRSSLISHKDGYPPAEYLYSVVKRGTPFVHMKRSSGEVSLQNVGNGLSSDGSRLIISSLKRNDDRPLWILNWGGCGTLAQALYDLMQEDVEKAHILSEKLYVYDIHGQDDCGAFICKNFPEIKWYRSTTSFWGFSGTPHRWGDTVGSVECVSNTWADRHIRRGPFEKIYPHTKYGLETDSPSLMAMINNGLTDRYRLEWGGHAGRFSRIPFPNVPAEFFTKSYLHEERPYYMYKDETDTFTYPNGETAYKDTFTTVSRWKNDYQNDMASRIDWALNPDYEKCCHNPIAVLNGDQSTSAIVLNVNEGEIITPSLLGSTDPDKGTLTHKAYCYPEAGTYRTLTINDSDTPTPSIEVPCGKGEEYHVIFEVENHGKIPLKAYRRLILRTGDTALSSEHRIIDDGEFSYSGDWSVLDDQYGCINDSCHRSSSSGSYADIKITGRRFMLIGNAHRTSGIAKISIDGCEIDEVDFYSLFKDTPNKNVTGVSTSVCTMQYLSPLLESGEHTVRISVCGKHNPRAEGCDIDIDAIVVFD